MASADTQAGIGNEPLFVEIVSIGEELLSGDSEIVDTNSIFITKQLKEIGLRVLYKTTVGDDEQRITDILKLALSRAKIVITTGGLGPTVDDMTRQGVANAFGRPLEFSQALLDDIAQKFTRFNMRMSDNNRVQAYVPTGATVIDNPVGTAPSFMVEQNGRVMISLPGVPREMKYLMEHAVVPILRDRVAPRGIIKTRVLRTAGIGESLVDEQVGEFEKLANPVVGLAAHSGQTDIRISARADTEAEADRLIADLEAEIRRRLGTYIFGVEKETLEHAFVMALQAAGMKLSLAEAGSGGLLHQMIEADPEGAVQLSTAEAYTSIEAARKAYQLPETSNLSNFQQLAEQIAAALQARAGGLALVVLTDAAGTAIGVTDGSAMRSRTYAYGGLDAGGPEWASGWGMSMGWYMLTQAAKERR